MKRQEIDELLALEDEWPRQSDLFDDELWAEFLAEWEENNKWFYEQIDRLAKGEITNVKTN